MVLVIFWSKSPQCATPSVDWTMFMQYLKAEFFNSTCLWRSRELKKAVWPAFSFAFEGVLRVIRVVSLCVTRLRVVNVFVVIAASISMGQLRATVPLVDQLEMGACRHKAKKFLLWPRERRQRLGRLRRSPNLAGKPRIKGPLNLVTPPPWIRNSGNRAMVKEPSTPPPWFKEDAAVTSDSEYVDGEVADEPDPSNPPTTGKRKGKAEARGRAGHQQISKDFVEGRSKVVAQTSYFSERQANDQGTG